MDQPRVVQAAKTRARAHKHSSREATGLAHQAVVALMSRLHCSSEGPVGTQRDGQVRRVQVTLGYNRCRTPWLGCAQTVARRVYADHRLEPGSREEGAQRSSCGLEPDSGNPTVRDHRGLGRSGARAVLLSRGYAPRRLPRVDRWTRCLLSWSSALSRWNAGVSVSPYRFDDPLHALHADAAPSSRGTVPRGFPEHPVATNAFRCPSGPSTELPLLQSMTVVGDRA